MLHSRQQNWEHVRFTSVLFASIREAIKQGSTKLPTATDGHRKQGLNTYTVVERSAGYLDHVPRPPLLIEMKSTFFRLTYLSSRSCDEKKVFHAGCSLQSGYKD